jgi:hypothetical protein
VYASQKCDTYNIWCKTKTDGLCGWADKKPDGEYAWLNGTQDKKPPTCYSENTIGRIRDFPTPFILLFFILNVSILLVFIILGCNNTKNIVLLLDKY